VWNKREEDRRREAEKLGVEDEERRCSPSYMASAEQE